MIRTYSKNDYPISNEEKVRDNIDYIMSKTEKVGDEYADKITK